MTVYFLDTSALVKRYVTEFGSNWVIAQCQPKAGNTIVISQAALVEAVAAFCRKTREQSIEQRISEAERDRNITLFKRDVRRQYTTVRVTSTVYDRAGNLCRIHRLRAYDAVQLASALLIRSKLAVIGVPTLTFVSADVELLSIASDEGLGVENPIAR